MTQSYISTRNASLKTSGAQAIIHGLAPDGGLYVLPHLSSYAIDPESLVSCPYEEIAFSIISKLLPDFPDYNLKKCIQNSYHTAFPNGNPAPLKKVGDTWVMELFHGPTSAFKDVALTFLPHLMKEAQGLLQDDKKILILTATSGDTGKAALDGFCHVPGTGIAVFYPHGGVSLVQQLQMSTQKGNNTAVCAIEGNFDDAQRGVKMLFDDKQLKKDLSDQKITLSSANSINIGRLIPQIVYYFSAYSQLRLQNAIAPGEKINFSVPTGNFGNILALYMAKKMGLPCEKMICASNSNNVLWEFLTTGVYNRNRPFHQTTSPSMDILVSSNLERLLYYISVEDCSLVSKWMNDLQTRGSYALQLSFLKKIKAEFSAGWIDDENGKAAIRQVFKEYQYLMDPHTAIAWQVMKEKAPQGPKVVVSTASPYKFVGTVFNALYGPLQESISELELLQNLETKTGTVAPLPLSCLSSKEIRFNDVMALGEMRSYVLSCAKNLFSSL